MTHVLRSERAADHPTRDRADHANIDPRPKHPKVPLARARPADKRDRPSTRE